MRHKSKKELFPEKRVSSIGFILNEDQKILLVKPSYYNYWHLPGGFVDENESPIQAVSREIKEEINLDLSPHRLIIINYTSAYKDQKEVIVFIFDFGVVTKNLIQSLKLDNEEIVDYGFFEKSKAMELVGPGRSKRLEMCYVAVEKDTFYYLDDDESLSK